MLMPTVLIFRKELLAISETFVSAQVNALKRFDPVFAGLRRTHPSLDVAPNPVLLSEGTGKLSDLHIKAYRLTGFDPVFHRKVREARPDLLHVHFATDGVIALPLVRAIEAPMVVTLHGFDVTIYDRLQQSSGAKQYLRRRRELWQRASVFLCVSEFIRRKALESGFPAEKLRVHRIGIDLAEFPFREERPRGKLVMFVGRLVQKKGVETLIQAMKTVQRRHPDSELVILGDGPLRQKLETMSVQLDVRCRFLGGQPSTVVRKWLRQAAVFCLPSVTAPNGDSEGLGMVTLEAQAMGIPAVGSNHGGIPEAIQHEKTGLLAKERSASELATCIRRFLEDPALAEACRRRASAHVRAKFDLATQTAELETIYDELLGIPTRKVPTPSEIPRIHVVENKVVPHAG
jgi:glycosyltransferase involved in cell wall biosynthesis